MILPPLVIVSKNERTVTFVTTIQMGIRFMFLKLDKQTIVSLTRKQETATSCNNCQ